MWSFIKFRQLVKSQETIVIKNNFKNLKSEFPLYLLRLAESLAFNRATGDAAGKDSASARPGAADGAFDLDALSRSSLSTIYRGVNFLWSRHKKYIFVTKI